MFPEIARAYSPDYEIFYAQYRIRKEILRNHLKDMEVTCRRHSEGVITFLVASCYVETGISSGWMGLLISSSTNLTFFNDTCYYMANES